MQRKAWRVFAFASLFSVFSREGMVEDLVLAARATQSCRPRVGRSIRRHQMGTVDKQGVVTMQELLVSSLATADALAKLLIEKGLITEAEFMQKLSAERAA